MKSIDCLYFLGNKVSNYEKKEGRVSYGTLAKSFDHTFIPSTILWEEEWEKIGGSEPVDDIASCYVIDRKGADILREWTDETILYNARFGMYLWGVRFGGVDWNQNLTSIKIDLKKTPLEWMGIYGGILPADPVYRWRHHFHASSGEIHSKSYPFDHERLDSECPFAWDIFGLDEADMRTKKMSQKEYVDLVRASGIDDNKKHFVCDCYMD